MRSRPVGIMRSRPVGHVLYIASKFFRESSNIPCNDRLKVTVLGEGMISCVLYDKPGHSDVFDEWVLIEGHFPGGRFRQNL